MLEKIISLILAFLMSVLGLAPAVQPEDAYTQAEWYALVVKEFELKYDLEDEHNYELAEDDAYYAVIQAAYDANILVGTYDASAAVTDFVVAKSLAVACGLETAPTDAALDLAIKAGFVTVTVSLFGEKKEAVISKEAANTALKAAGKYYLDSLLKPVENSGTVSTVNNGDLDMSDLALVENSDGFTLQTADGDVIGEDEIVALDYEGSVNPFAQPEIAGINNQSILDDIEVDFDIGGLNVYAGLQDGGVDFKLSGDINGVNLEKAWELRNFNIDTKFEGNLSVNDIKTSYVILNYDLTDKTIATTSKAWSLDESELPEGSDDVDFFARVENNLFEMKEGSDSEIDIFSCDIAIPNCPAITVGITAKLIVTFDGRAELRIVTNETRGVVVVNNNVRTVNETVKDENGFYLNAQARVEAKLGLYVDLSIVSITLVDLGVEVGIGVHVTLEMTGGTSMYTLELPWDYLQEVNFVFPNSENISGKVNTNIYFIVTISVGENSIIEKIGLSETWNLVTEENGTFYTHEFTFKGANVA